MKALTEPVNKIYVWWFALKENPPPLGLMYDRVFKLHFITTTWILGFFYLLSTGREYWGSPIQCFGIKGIPEAVSK